MYGLKYIPYRVRIENMKILFSPGEESLHAANTSIFIGTGCQFLLLFRNLSPDFLITCLFSLLYIHQLLAL